jgi:hypothetical protein
VTGAAQAAAQRLLTPGRIVTLILFCVFLLVVVEGWRYPPEARLFPTLVGAAGMTLAIAVFALHGGDDSPAGEHGAAAPGRWRRLLAVAAAPVYSLLVWVIGFYAASLAALVVLPLLLGFRGIFRVLLIALGAVAVIAAVFSWGMEMTLPAGLVGDWILTNFVYDR